MEKLIGLASCPNIYKQYYSNIHIASFITACAKENLSINEITDLTKELIHTGIGKAVGLNVKILKFDGVQPLGLG